VSASVFLSEILKKSVAICFIDLLAVFFPPINYTHVDLSYLKD